MIHQPMGKLLAFALSLVWLLVGCARDRAEQQAAATASAPAERPKSEVSVVRFGYQKIGAPFLLKSRSESLDKRLTDKGAKAE